MATSAAFSRLSGGLLVLAALVLALGILPWEQALQVGARVWPVLAFLVLIKIASDLLDRAGLFEMLAHRMALGARGRTWVLFCLFSALCAGCTVLLGLDATAVLLTPIAIRLARQACVEVLPLAYACLWFAPAGSMLLPVSNLTNLLAQESLGWNSGEFVARTWLVQIVILACTGLVLAALNLRSLRGRFELPARPDGVDRVAARTGAAGALGFALAVVVGAPAWLAALGLCALMAVTLVLRRADRPSLPPVRRVLRFARAVPPWAMAAFAVALFVLVEAAAPIAEGGVQMLMGTGASDVQGVLRTEAVSAAGANLVNNLPAYLLLEPAAHTETQMIALLTGVNAGSAVLPWGSLSTLLWLQVCRERSVPMSTRRLVGHGAILTIVLLTASSVVIAAMG